MAVQTHRRSYKERLSRYKRNILQDHADEIGLVTSGLFMSRLPKLYFEAKDDIQDAYLANIRKFKGKKGFKNLSGTLSANRNRRVILSNELKKALRGRVKKSSKLGKFAYSDFSKKTTKSRGVTGLAENIIRDFRFMRPSSYKKGKLVKMNRRSLAKILPLKGIKGLLLTAGALTAYPIGKMVQAKYKKKAQFQKQLQKELREGIWKGVKSTPADLIKGAIGENKFLYNSKTVRRTLGKYYGYKGHTKQYWGRAKGGNYAGNVDDLDEYTENKLRHVGVR